LRTSETIRGYLRYAFLIVYLGVCLSAGWLSARDGLSRLKSKSALDENNLAAAQAAVRLSPGDPEGYYARAKALGHAGDMKAGIDDLQRAVQLRPRDHFLWLELGFFRSQADDPAAAIGDFQRSVALAPFYAQPRWYLGNTQLSVDQTEEGFAELRRAAASDPTLYPELLELAAQVYGDDAGAIQRAASPRTAEERIALAGFFIRHDLETEEVLSFLKEGAIGEEGRQALLKDLMAAKKYELAFAVWAAGRARAPGAEPAPSGVTNPGFESGIENNNVGFDWLLGGSREGLRVSIDSQDAFEGRGSLRIDFKGKSALNGIVTQTVLVSPESRYRLSFRCRTKDLVTGGLPAVAVEGAGDGGESRPLADVVLPAGTTDWQNFTIDFSTPKESGPVTIVLRRNSCLERLCPAFGSLWLDAFSLDKVD
jgi:tetratricopeptide (TPR) repeat protein